MKTTFKNISLSSVFHGNKTWDQNSNNYNNHRITVVNKENGQRCSFEYWGSIANPMIQTKEELLFAFQCFLSDSSSGNQTFDDFCSEYGYDEDSIQAYKTWKKCNQSTQKAQRLFNDFYEVYNELLDLNL